MWILAAHVWILYVQGGLRTRVSKRRHTFKKWLFIRCWLVWRENDCR